MTFERKKHDITVKKIEKKKEQEKYYVCIVRRKLVSVAFTSRR